MSNKKKNFKRLMISTLICVFLIITSFSTISVVSKKTNTYVDYNESFEEGNHLRYTFNFQKPDLSKKQLFEDTYTKITIPGTIAIGKNVGEPCLPVSFQKILLPPKTDIKSVQVSGIPIEINTEIDLKNTPIKPYQQQIPIGQEPPEQIQINDIIYNSEDIYPDKQIKNQEIGYCRGYSILTVALNPVQYSPSKGEIWYYQKMTIDIELETTEEINQFYRNDYDDEEWVKKLVVNPEITDLYTEDLTIYDYPGGLCDPSDDYDYVIITTTHEGLDYWETGGTLTYNWEDLMDKHHNDDGLECNLVTIEDIDACTDYHNADPLFNDLEAHIREFCKDAYQDWETDYIFIGGDAEWIPARLMDTEYETNIDTDIYWSNLDNNFNDDGDYLWGEEGDDGFDLYAEIFIGRITCDEPQDVSNWMTKSFYYADNVDMDYLDNAAFYGGNLGWNCEGDDFIDFAAIKGTTDWLGPIPGEHGPYPDWLGFQYGFETWNNLNPGNEYDLTVKWTAEPPNPGGWQGGSTSAAINGFKTDINNDQVTLISGVAHADPYMSLDVDDTEWENQYHNTKPFFMHDFGCHCGDMDDAGDGVLHSMLFHSDTELAFACVYNTCYGWGSFDDTNSSSALQMKSFWDYMFDTTNHSGQPGNWQLGKAQTWSKDYMAPTIDWTYTSAPGSWRAVIQGCLLFGDPAQRIKPKLFDETPPETTISYTGDPGENDWYIRSGEVVLTATDQFSSVDETYYKIDDGEWELYTEPFAYNVEGLNVFYFYSIDIAGNIEPVQTGFIKIDFSTPNVWITKQTISDGKIKFTAHINDDESGSNRAEFYLDDELQIIDEDQPFEWTWIGSGRHTIKAIGYNNAGLSGEDTASTSYAQKRNMMFRQNIIPILIKILDHLNINFFI